MREGVEVLPLNWTKPNAKLAGIQHIHLTSSSSCCETVPAKTRG